MPVRSKPCGPKRGASGWLLAVVVVGLAVGVVVMEVEQATAIRTIASGRVRRMISPSWLFGSGIVAVVSSECGGLPPLSHDRCTLSRRHVRAPTRYRPVARERPEHDRHGSARSVHHDPPHLVGA